MGRAEQRVAAQLGTCRTWICGGLTISEYARENLARGDPTEGGFRWQVLRSAISIRRTRVGNPTDVVHLGGTTAARLTLEPGWTWSDCVKPVAGTESCQHRHVGVVHSGRLRVTHEDGTVLDLGPGERM